MQDELTKVVFTLCTYKNELYTTINMFTDENIALNTKGKLLNPCTKKALARNPINPISFQNNK